MLSALDFLAASGAGFDAGLAVLGAAFGAGLADLVAFLVTAASFFLVAALALAFVVLAGTGFFLEDVVSHFLEDRVSFHSTFAVDFGLPTFELDFHYSGLDFGLGPRLAGCGAVFLTLVSFDLARLT